MIVLPNTPANPILPEDGIPTLTPEYWGVASSVTDVPSVVITNSYDDEDKNEDDDDDLDETVDDDDDVYEEVESFEDFDDEFDEDFEDEFDEDYEDLDKIDDEDLDAEIEEENGGDSNAPVRYEEEFDDVDGQTKFIPDNPELGLPAEVIMPDELEETEDTTTDFDEFDDDENDEEFNEFDN